MNKQEQQQRCNSYFNFSFTRNQEKLFDASHYDVCIIVCFFFTDFDDGLYTLNGIWSLRDLFFIFFVFVSS